MNIIEAIQALNEGKAIKRPGVPERVGDQPPMVIENRKGDLWIVGVVAEENERNAQYRYSMTLADLNATDWEAEEIPKGQSAW